MTPKSPTQSTETQGSTELANSKWERFAQFVADGKTEKEAYQLVYGCKASTARIESAKLYTKPLVRARVRFLQAENSKAAALGREETLRILADIARSPTNDVRARIQAIQENNRMNGWSENNFNVRGEGIVFNLGNLLGDENGG